MMGPALTPAQIGAELAACGALGGFLGLLRAVFPSRGRGAFLPDLLLAGALLLGCQSYAAAYSADGALRWYLLLAAFGAALGAQTLLDGPLGAVRRAAAFPLERLRRHRRARQQARKAAKVRRNEKRLAKKPKKNLPRERRLLYNSNVSK